MENTQQNIDAEKKFGADVNELYDAWINPDKLKQWWHPAGNRLVHVENEVREGGAILYEFENSNGEKTITINGQYKEVKPAQRLVYSWDWKIAGSDHLSHSPYELTIEFSGEESGSRIRVTQTSEDANEAVHPRRQGWEDELESLNQFLG